MAHFYQVVSEDNKSDTQFYPNADENQTVQYVITDSSSQQFQGQPLVVVEGEPQQVIIEPTQVTYPQNYIIQDSSIDFSGNQQVFYMANPTHSHPIIVEQTMEPQPLVLNHQIMQTSIPRPNLVSPVHASVIATPEKSINQIQQLRNQMKGQFKCGALGRGIVNTAVQKTVATMAPIGPQAFPKQAHSSEDDMFSDDFDQYSKFPLQKGSPMAADKLGNPAMRKKPRLVTAKVRARPKPPLRKGPIGSFSRNLSSEEQSFNDQNTYSLEQRRLTGLPQNNSQYLIQPPKPRSNKTTKPLPDFLHNSQIQNIIASTPMSEEFFDSIRMLVLLENGEQRLITFTLPKEACTIQEILEQVNVPFTPETNIQVSETHTNGLNYVVAVGNVPGFNQEHQNESQELYVSQSPPETEPVVELPKVVAAPSPEPTKEQPKLIEGKLAVCNYCGIVGEDFNRCMRCKRKLPDNVKSVPLTANNGKKIDMIRSIAEKRLAMVKANGVPKMNLLHKKRPMKPKIIECETVVVSSDDEDSDAKSPTKSVSEQLMEKLGGQITLSPISKEPSVLDIQKHTILSATRSCDKVPEDKLAMTLITCRTVRIGSYRYVPPEPVRLDSNSITFKVPHPKDDALKRTIKIESCDIVKVLISYQKTLPVIFFYLLPNVGNVVRAMLDMTQGSDFYFDPLTETEESHRRITLLPEALPEECKHIIQKIYQRQNILEELTCKEANDILMKACPKDLSRTSCYNNEIRQILMYPKEGTGRIAINTEDYLCLGQDQFLNDVIIDFYLKYLLLNLPKEKQEKIHIFSTFFYKRLTTKPTKASKKSHPSEVDPNLTAAQKRHARVKTWTKNVNIFEKDFIVVPINENCHWFLAIICYANMNGSHTMEGQPIKIEPRQSKSKRVGDRAVDENKMDVPPIMCEDPEMSDKDEAEGDESELDSDDSDETPPATLSVENNSKRPPIKQPCILIFDSLAGASRSRVVATLRDYLTWEHNAKLSIEKNYTKEVIKGACPKVPQQTNFTDCGLYLLQYVEHFFNDPIKDYYIPILHLKNWFPEITVTKKREDISILIKSLMQQSNIDQAILPEVVFPTLNGELTERTLMEHEDSFMDPDENEGDAQDEDEDYVPPNFKLHKANSSEENSDAEKSVTIPIMPSSESATNKNEFVEKMINSTILKPDTSDMSKPSNKETMSYLKSKRIIRHKNINSEAPDAKKLKASLSSKIGT